MVTNNLDKFQLLLWKSWIIQWNHKFQFFLEMVLPVVFASLMVLVRTMVDPEIRGVLIYDEQLELDNLSLLRWFLFFKPFLRVKYHLAYSPNTNSIFKNIVKEAAFRLKLTYSGYPNARALAEVLVDEPFLCGIEFDDSMAYITAYPEQLNYKIRFPSELRTDISPFVITWLTNRRFWRLDRYGPRNVNHTDGGLPVGYLSEGFLPVQYTISRAFIKQAATNLKTSLPKVLLQRFPYPPYIDDPLIVGLPGMMGIVILLSYIYPCMCTVKYITSEKEKCLKEVMKIMGLQNWLHWMAWFVKSFVMMSISAFAMAIVMTVKWRDDVAVLTYSSLTPVFFFLLIYTIASITFCFMLATFFSKATTAASATGLIWFITYLPFTMLSRNYDALSVGTKLAWSLFSNTALGIGVRLISADEAEGEGLQWSNMFIPVSADDKLAVGHIILIMLLSSVIHLVICLYIEQIYPGEYGVPQKWNFPFKKSFWIRVPDRKYTNLADVGANFIPDNPDAFEKEPINGEIGLSIRNLSKKFQNKIAVNNVSLNMYAHEITVLLGHNGAGKTTTISMLIGMFPPTSGTAIVNGYDIRTNVDGVRSSLGICPQHNILFDDLTVRDHLIFYSRLKGLKGEELYAEVRKYIKKIDLEDKADFESFKLSGGMKRKLSVICAFCGGTKVVLCDEPSSGMDPAARRQLWDLLQSEKYGRTVLLTTHFMDEADVLGDRIAIMSAGVLKCVGTSFFLKKKFGSGYHLICVKKDDCDSGRVTSLLRKYIPNIKPDTEIGSELSYRLPDRYSFKFEEMLQDLESNSDDLKLNGYGLSTASLEEVFMKVGVETPKEEEEEEEEEEEVTTALRSIKSSSNFGSRDGESLSSSNMFLENQHLLRGANLRLNQCRSMIFKKYLLTIRHRVMMAIQNLLPILFVTLTFVFGANRFDKLPPLALDVFQLPNTVTVLETSPDVKSGSLEANIAKSYKEIASSFGPNHKFEETGNQTFIDYILELGKTIQPRINAQYIAAATVHNGRIIAWLNNKPLHSAPVTLNLIQNAMARVLIGPQASISVTNAPQPFSREAKFEMLESGQNFGTEVATNLSFCMCFVSGLYIISLIKERESRAKLLQFVSGVRILTFWVSHFVWDIFTITITTIIIIFTFTWFQQEGYKTFDELGRNMAMIMLFNVIVLPFIYISEALFSDPAIGYTRMAVFNIFFGNAMFITIIVMKIPVFDSKEKAEFLEKILLVSPHFALAHGLSNLYVNGETKKLCSQLLEKFSQKLTCVFHDQCCNLKSYFAWEAPGIQREVVYLCATGSVCIFILFFKEYRIKDIIRDKMNRKSIRRKPLPPPDDGYFDEDVQEEKQRVRRMTPSKIAKQNLVLDSITKIYGRFVAVNQISLIIRQ